MWLSAKGRYKKAEESLARIARYNGVKIKGPLLTCEPDGQMKPNNDSTDMYFKDETFVKENKYFSLGVTKLITNRTLLKHTVIFCIYW